MSTAVTSLFSLRPIIRGRCSLEGVMARAVCLGCDSGARHSCLSGQRVFARFGFEAPSSNDCPLSISILCVSSGACSGVPVSLCCRRCCASSDVGRWPVLLGIVYVMAREWWSACMVMLDPCSGSDGISSTPLQLLVRAHARPMLVFLC